MLFSVLGDEGQGQGVQLLEAIGPVYLFDPGARVLNCSAEE
jgi:hypothetical protein